MTLRKNHMVILWLIWDHLQLICLDIVQNKLHFPQNSSYQTVVLVLVILTLNDQNYYTLKFLRNLNKTSQPAFLLHCPKEFIRFLCECIVNLIERHLTRVEEISLLASKNNLESSHQNYNPNFQKTYFGLKRWNTILICIYGPCLNNFTFLFNYEVKKFLLVPKKLWETGKRKLSQHYSEIEKKNKRFSQLLKKRKKKLCPKKNDRPPKEPKTDLEFVFFLS